MNWIIMYEENWVSNDSPPASGDESVGKVPHGSLDADATNMLMECRILLKLICMPTIMTSVLLLLDHSNSHLHLLQHRQNRGRINGHAVSQGKTHSGKFMPQAQQASQSAISSRESSTRQVSRHASATCFS